MDVKFDGTEETGFNLIPNDWYEAEVTSIREKISKAGNEMVEVEFVIASGKYERRKLWTNLVPMGRGLYNCRRFIEACGTEWEKNKNLQIDDSYQGRMIKVEVTTKTWEEKERNEIKFGGYEKLDESAVAKGGVPF